MKAMERHLEFEIRLVIEELLEQGIVKIFWSRFYRWFGMTYWSDKALIAFLERVEEVHGSPLSIGYSSDVKDTYGVFFLVDRAKTVSMGKVKKIVIADEG